MKSYSTRYSTALLFIIAFAFIFVGCSSDNTMAPNTSENGLQVQSNTGPVTLLKMNNAASPNSLAKSEGSDYSAEKFITASQGGQVVVGNADLGFSRIIFQPNDLLTDLTISLTWGDGDYCDGIFGPHGIQFNRSVRVELSYKDADLTGVNEDDLKIYYFNENTNVWEHIGGAVDKVNKIVIGYLDHFSRYAIVKT